MTPQYQTPEVPANWADSRETHQAVAMAIHAISDSTRTPQAIWEAPTQGEWDNVAMAVENYIACGLYPVEGDGRYQWGLEAIQL